MHAKCSGKICSINEEEPGEKLYSADTFAIIYVIVGFVLVGDSALGSEFGCLMGRSGAARGQAPAPKMRQTFYALAYFIAFGISNNAEP